MKQAGPNAIVGWREWINLPELTDIPIKAKIDTGAKTSAIHAWNINPIVRNKRKWVEFELHPDQKSAKRTIKCEAQVYKQKTVKSSNGLTEERFSILTDIEIGPWVFSTEITLTNRDEMGFRMLLGRSFLKNHFMVDSGHSWLQSDNDTKGIVKK